MAIRCDAEATCAGCGAKARCTVDMDLIMGRTLSSPGGAMYGLPHWFYKQGSGLLTSDYNLACSEKCVKVLSKESSYSGEWKHCPGA
jgi:hypothetical protein